ncbi:hypothetical protein PAMC26510_32060 [Caballeronia sordidicola]|uniref:Uncharacterized protein n=1 Tax=Caballeronia sordidicola TaxID=196367 RepID=A0A242M7E2_CABSO|nr:hypothetical protein PAMC26510_32060 [Caballeronia sordidicola]
MALSYPTSSAVLACAEHRWERRKLHVKMLRPDRLRRYAFCIEQSLLADASRIRPHVAAGVGCIDWIVVTHFLDSVQRLSDNAG